MAHSWLPGSAFIDPFGKNSDEIRALFKQALATVLLQNKERKGKL
jgi:hypothetical protein